MLKQVLSSYGCICSAFILFCCTGTPVPCSLCAALGTVFFFGWLWPLHHPNTCRGGVCKKSHHLFQTTVSVPGVPLVGAGQYHFHWQPCLEALATVRDVAWKWFTYERIMEVGTGHRHCWHFHLGVSAARTVFDGGWLSKHTCSMRRCSVRLPI